MKCPYCNSELRTFMLEEPAVWYCPNHCAPMLPPKIWQDLIDGKKVQDLLNRIWHTSSEKPDGRIIITERGEFYYDVNGYYCGNVYWANNTLWAYLDDIIELRTITE